MMSPQKGTYACSLEAKAQMGRANKTSRKPYSQNQSSSDPLENQSCVRCCEGLGVKRVKYAQMLACTHRSIVDSIVHNFDFRGGSGGCAEANEVIQAALVEPRIALLR